MPKRYQDIYPEQPLLTSADLGRKLATDLLSLEFFEAEPAEMPHEIFEQHHILINLRDEPYRVENWRDGEHRDFISYKNEIIVTPAGMRSGWKWYAKSKVIVITLEPSKLKKFAQSQLGIVLGDKQLSSIPQFIDEDITHAGVMLMDALKSDMGSDVMFESFARVFLTKLIHKYGLKRQDEITLNKRFVSERYKRVLDYVSEHFDSEIKLDTLAEKAGFSSSHFSRLFKQTIGQSPHQFVMAYRVEQAKSMLLDPQRSKNDIALSCGFADQAHFSRVFKKFEGVTPRQYCLELAK